MTASPSGIYNKVKGTSTNEVLAEHQAFYAHSHPLVEILQGMGDHPQVR